jgi:hypothetical protein
MREVVTFITFFMHNLQGNVLLQFILLWLHFIPFLNVPPQVLDAEARYKSLELKWSFHLLP